MKKVFFFLIFSTSASFGVEELSLTTPYVVDPRSTSTFRVEAIELRWKDQLVIFTVGDGTLSRRFSYEGQTAKNMMTTLNKANLTNNSLHKRVLNQLISDGHLSGTIGGSPD